MLLSILTCVKSDTSDLAVTYESLLPFLCPEMGWIIKYSQHCSTAFVDSIPVNSYIKKIQSEDFGLYEGLNQALNVCESKYYAVLGAGDGLLQEGFWSGLSEMDAAPEMDAYFFACKLNLSGRIFTPKVEDLTFRMSCPHPSSILKVHNSKEIGGFNTSYEIASDYDHICRYTNKFQNYKASSIVIALFKGGGISDVRTFEAALEEELIRIRIFKSHDLAVRGRLLANCAANISSVLAQSFRRTPDPSKMQATD